MKEALSRTIAAQWAWRVGVLFNVPPSRRTPDLEKLLIDTARRMPDDPRLFVMSATWLGRYGRLVARGRLARLTGQIADPNARAALGLLLDSVRRLAAPTCWTW